MYARLHFEVHRKSILSTGPIALCVSCMLYIPPTRGHVCVCYFTRAIVSAEQALSVLFT